MVVCWAVQWADSWAAPMAVLWAFLWVGPMAVLWAVLWVGPLADQSVVVLADAWAVVLVVPRVVQ